MQKIISIADPEITSIPIFECGEEVIDIKTLSGQLKYGPPPETPLTKPYYTKMRKTVYQKLCEAQQLLPHGYRFLIYEGLRSLDTQVLLFEQLLTQNSNMHPEMFYEEVFWKTSKLVSPILNLDGTKNIPPHCTGGAIDLEVIDEQGKILDMGMRAQDWYCTDINICSTSNKYISKQAQKNRLLLLDSLTSVGFVNYVNEWWHYSYGDRYWALIKNRNHAMYGLVDI